MANFPRKEADVATLAAQIISGLAENADDFPSPPLDPAVLQLSLDDYKKKHYAVVDARATVGLACGAKDKALKKLIDEMKAEH